MVRRREGYFSNWKKIARVSFGLLYILFTLFLIFHTNQYVPDSQKDLWFRVFIGYGILNSIILANADTRNKLFNVEFRKFFPRFMIFFSLFIFVFYVILVRIGDPLDFSFFDIIGSIPLWLAVIHAFVFATTESVIWQGYLDYEVGHPWSELIAGVFHWGIWTGGAIVVIPSAALLFMFFSLVNWYFRKDKNDLAPAIGCHTAFNFIKIGLLVSIAGGV